jgi:hypothetical protein
MCTKDQTLANNGAGRNEGEEHMARCNGLSQKEGQDIMGDNFLSIEAVEKSFRIRFTPEESEALAEIPYTENTLRACKNTHLLFPGYPLKIPYIVRRSQWRNQKLFDTQLNSWCTQPVFAGGHQRFFQYERVCLRWYLTSRDIVAESTNKTYEKQRTLLWPNEFVPNATEMIYTITLCYLATNVRLFERIYARTVSVCDDRRIMVGFFGPNGLRVGCGMGYMCDRSENIGLASSYHH